MTAIQAQRAFYAAEVDRLDAEIHQAESDRDGMYSPHENDRKARHINMILRSRTAAEGERDFYGQQIAAAQAELAGY